MNMDLQQRSFSSHLIRPKPKVSFEKSSQTWIVATSWGEPGIADQVIQSISDQLVSISEADATVVRSSVGGLSESGNRMLAAARVTQEKLFAQFNKQEYTVAVELALITKVRNTLSWVQIGAPSLLLSTAKGLQPLSHSTDWSGQFGQEAPLVGQAMGLYRDSNFQCGSHQVKENEKLLLLAKSYIPASLYGLDEIDLNSVAQCLVNENPAHPFWLGLIGF
jgi:hypothetical protein